MEPTADGVRSRSGAAEQPGAAVESLQFHEEIQRLMSLPPPQDTGSSFTALLELPPVQALELLHSPSSNVNGDLLLTTSLSRDFHLSHVKNEPLDNLATTTADSVLIDNKIVNHSPPPLVPNSKSVKRKAKGASERTKKERCDREEEADNAEKLPYVHVRARRGQATDSHSLAERARREKINVRMKLLQELVPGCNKISGTALVLDEIINHVQSLQRQVEFLSMRLAAVNPKIDFSMDSLLAVESGSFMDSNFPIMLSHIDQPEVQINGNRLQCPPQWQYDTYHQPIWVKKEENLHLNFLTPENSPLSYDSSANSASLVPNQLKMEL